MSDRPVPSFFVAKLLAIVTCFGMCGNLFADFVTVVNSSAINIPDVGVATTYPSNVTMAGVSGTVTSVTVSLSGVSHNFVDDVSAAIVSPNGTAVLLFSGAGPNFLQRGSKSVSNLTGLLMITQRLPCHRHLRPSVVRSNLVCLSTTIPSRLPARATFMDLPLRLTSRKISMVCGACTSWIAMLVTPVKLRAAGL